MSLIKKPVMTNSKLAANRRNATLSQGPATREGRSRNAAAHLRHGFYAKGFDVTLRNLGEDPGDYVELLEGLCMEFNPCGALQERLVVRLARVLWMMDRSERQQEGHALHRAKLAGCGRENRLHAQMLRLKMTAETLRSLARSVGRWHYVTSRDDLATVKMMHEQGQLHDMGNIALALFIQLQEPGTDEDGTTEFEKARRVVEDVKMIFGIGQTPYLPSHVSAPGCSLAAPSPAEAEPPAEMEDEQDSEGDDRYPGITEEDWKARERARKLLRNLLSRQAEECEEQRRVLLRETLNGPSAFDLAAETAPSHAEAWMARRTQDANMREVRRLTTLLLKIKTQARLGKAPGPPEDAHLSHDVLERKGS